MHWHVQIGLLLLPSSIAVTPTPNVNVVSVDRTLMHRAIDFYRGREDKEWGLTDCISFIVMEDHGLTDALTTDEHFQQAGFRALLRVDH